MTGFAALDIRWITALCQIVAGAFLVRTALRVWLMPVHARAVKFEPVVKPEGIARMMEAWPLVFIFGLMLTASGFGRGAYYLNTHGWLDGEWTAAAGLTEAIFSVWVTGSIIIVKLRPWKRG